MPCARLPFSSRPPMSMSASRGAGSVSTPAIPACTACTWWSREAQVQEAVPLAQALVDTQEVSMSPAVPHYPQTVYCNFCNTALGQREARVEDGKSVFFHVACHVSYLKHKGQPIGRLLSSGGDTSLFTNT